MRYSLEAGREGGFRRALVAVAIVPIFAACGSGGDHGSSSGDSHEGGENPGGGGENPGGGGDGADTGEWSRDTGSADAGSSGGEDAGDWSADAPWSGGRDAGIADTGSSGGGPDVGTPPEAEEDAGAPEAGWGGNTNISLSGSSDFGFFRALLERNEVPRPEDFNSAGFFAEHHLPLPEPVCGERICLQTALGVLSALTGSGNCTMLRVGLNSPIVADPAARPPLSLTVVVDTSGSMVGDDRIGYVRDGLGMMVDNLADDDRIALVSYSDGARLLLPATDVRLQRSRIRDAIEELEADGATNLYDGLEMGYEEALDAFDSGRQNRVILLSDGNPTAGTTATASILAMSAAYNSEDIGLTVIGLGNDFNAELMRSLAEQADGNYYFLESPVAVSEVFTEEISFFTVPVAYDLRLTLREGSDYTFGRAYGSPMWEDTSSGGVLDIPSVFLAHRDSHEDVHEGAGRRGGGSALLVEMEPRRWADDGSGATDAQVAIVDVRFREPGTNRIVTDTVTVRYPYAEWVLLRAGHWEPSQAATTQKAFVMLNLYVAFEQASHMWHEIASDDARTEAVQMLENIVQAVVDYNEEVEDVDIAADLEIVNDLIDVMHANGADPEPAPPNPDPWPVD